MSQTLLLDTHVTHITNPTSSKIHDQERAISKRLLLSSEIDVSVGRGSIFTAIFSTLLLRIASRTSFVLLGFYLGEHFTSATVVVLVLEAFYITELILAPIVGSLSDRLGRKPFLLSAPLMGSVAALCLAGATLLFPHPHATPFDARLVVLLLIVLVGRLLEGVATALNAPSSLGYITEVTSDSDRLRARVMTAFEVATVGGLALAIPFGGKISSLLGTWGFFVVITLHLINGMLIAFFLKESVQRTTQVNTHHSLTENLSLLRHKRIFTFLPAWLSVNALVGAWMTLITIMLAYPEPVASLRHPGQLLYGGFSQELATLLVGGFGLLFLAGMGLWMLVLPRLRRTTVMFIGLGGLSVSIFGLTLINGLAENLAHVPESSKPLLLLTALPGGAGSAPVEWLYPGFTDPPGGDFRTAAGQTGSCDGLILSRHGSWTINWRISRRNMCRPRRLLRVDGLLSGTGPHLTMQCSLYTHTRSRLDQEPI